MTALSNIRIIAFAKAPRAGEAKTRLIPALGHAGSAALARRLLEHTMQQAVSAQLGEVELCASPWPDELWTQLNLPASLIWSAQGEGDLGARLARAAKRAIAADDAVILIGTDCPALDGQVLRDIAHALAQHDAVIVPASDGGYVALGLSQFDARLFSDMAWSAADVAAHTCQRIAACGWSLKQLPTLHDIDEAADLVWLPENWTITHEN